MTDRPAAKNAPANAARFGALAGVFTPTVLTILGIILFLRMGWVVGQTGLVGAFFIMALAHAISLFTAFSLSSVATNMHVKAGGTYYMITRTLGVEIGGAIGIPLYLSQAISVAFYLIGFTEAFSAMAPNLDGRFLASGLALAFGLLAYSGADFAMKVQFFILGVLGLSLISFFSGGWGHWVTPELTPPAQPDAGFWQVFAVFFPAVTGIMVGVSMSGDLKNPSKDIPKGTLSAIVITGAIYLAVTLWLAFHATEDQLRTNTHIMQDIALFPSLIYAGVWASTLSSALGSVMAAPRTLAAMANDRVVPAFIGSRLGSATEPRLAVIITTLVALSIIWMGNLNFVAQIITMFFLNTYGMINLAAGLERMVGNPSFRPQYRVHWLVSLLGAAGCYGAMFLISPLATFVAVVVSYGIFVLLGRRSIQQNWGDLKSGIWFSLARSGLIRLESEPKHVKNWRPNIVAFCKRKPVQEELMQLGSWLSTGRGIVTFYHLLVGEYFQYAGRGLRQVAARHMSRYLEEKGVAAFADAAIVNDFQFGVLGIMQTHGIAGLEPNTALLGWSDDHDHQNSQLELMRNLSALDKSLLLLHRDKTKGFGRRRRIDVWWKGHERNTELMLILAYLISRSPQWEGSEIRVLTMLASEEALRGAEEHLSSFLEKVRLEAAPFGLLRADPDHSFISILREYSTNTDLTLVGLYMPPEDDISNHAMYLRKLLGAQRNSVILVHSGESEDILGQQ